MIFNIYKIYFKLIHNTYFDIHRSEEEVKKEVHNSNSTLRCHSIKSFDSSDEENVVSNKVHNSELTKELENDWVSVKLEEVNCLHNT